MTSRTLIELAIALTSSTGALILLWLMIRRRGDR